MGFLSGVKIDLCTNPVVNGFQTNSCNPAFSFGLGRSFVLPDMENMIFHKCLQIIFLEIIAMM